MSQINQECVVSDPLTTRDGEPTTELLQDAIGGAIKQASSDQIAWGVHLNKLTFD